MIEFIKFVLPFERCRACAAFDPAQSVTYADNKPFLATRTCAHHDICEKAEKARKEVEED